MGQQDGNRVTELWRHPNEKIVETTNKKLKAINLPFITDLPAETFHRQQHHKI